MISKSLSTSEKFASLTAQAGDLAEFCQALYPLVLCHSDDFGRLQGDTFTIKHMCFPTSPRSVAEFAIALAHLHAVGLIVRYEVDSKLYIQIQNFDPHQQGLHKRTASKFPDIPDNSGKVREFPGQENLREGKGTEGNGTKFPVMNNKLDRKSDPPIKANGQSAPRAFGGPIIGRNIHLDHAACDDLFSYCVPAAVHRKFADLLAPRHGGDREAAKLALQAWYPTIWKAIPEGSVMGDAFKFWQACFDADFATPTPTKKRGMSAKDLADAVRADMKAAGEL